MDFKLVSFILLVKVTLSMQQVAPLSPSVLTQSAQQQLSHLSAASSSPDLSKEKRGLSSVADSVHQGSSSLISVPVHLPRHYHYGGHRSLGVPLHVPVRVTVPRSYPVTVLLDPAAAVGLDYALGLYSGHYSSSLDYNTLLTYLAAARAASHLSTAAHTEHSALANYAALTAAAAAKLVR